MKPLLYALLLALLLPLTGCFSSDTVIKLNPDGSGTVNQTTLLSSEMLAQMQAIMGEIVQQMGGKESSKDSLKIPDLFSESEARASAAKMGEGVTFVSSRKLKTERSEGMEAIYAFKDVTKLRISQKPNPPGPQGMGMMPEDSSGEATFRFKRLPNGHSLLTVVFPQSKQSKPDEEKVSSSSATKMPTGEAPSELLEQAKKLFRGLRIGIAVEVNGNLVQTNSLYAEGSKVTLLEMDFDQLLSNEALLEEMASLNLQNPSLEDAKRLLKGVKGFKVNLEPELRIEFAGR